MSVLLASTLLAFSGLAPSALTDEEVIAIGRRYIHQIEIGEKPVGVSQLDILEQDTGSLIYGEEIPFRPIQVAEIRIILSKCRETFAQVRRVVREGKPVVAYDVQWRCDEQGQPFAATGFIEVDGSQVSGGRLLWNQKILTIQVPVSKPNASERESQ